MPLDSTFLEGDLSINFLNIEGDFSFFSSSESLLDADIFRGLSDPLLREVSDSLLVLVWESLSVTARAAADSFGDFVRDGPSLLMKRLTLFSALLVSGDRDEFRVLLRGREREEVGVSGMVGEDVFGERDLTLSDALMEDVRLGGTGASFSAAAFLLLLSIDAGMVARPAPPRTKLWAGLAEDGVEERAKGETVMEGWDGLLSLREEARAEEVELTAEASLLTLLLEVAREIPV